jgi:hypothetical protein
MKRTPLKRVSSKRSKELREYAKLRKAYLEAHPYCEVYLAENGLKYEGNPIDAPLATDIHHRRGRWHGRLNETEHWLAVCRESHERIHYHPQWAYERGYMLPR